MAFIILKSGKHYSVKAKPAIRLWEIMQGQRQGTEEEMRYCDKVDKIYLSRYNAPMTYLVNNRKNLGYDPFGTIVKKIEAKFVETRKDLV